MCCWPGWSENLNFTATCKVKWTSNWTSSQIENKCFYPNWHELRWLTWTSDCCRFNDLTWIRIHEGGRPRFLPPRFVHVCVTKRKSVWVHICICAWLRVKEVMEEWVQERQTAKQHQYLIFTRGLADWKKKWNQMKSRKGLFSFLLCSDTRASVRGTNDT